LKVELLEDRRTPASLTSAFIAQAYQDMFQRTVDPSGQSTWGGFVDGGATRSLAVVGIETATSNEYWIAQTQHLYSLLLKRTADPQGQELSAAFLAAGGSIEQLAATIAGSAEYFQDRAGSSNDGFLSALYQDALGRAVDASGQAAFDQALAAGLSRTQAALLLFQSQEYRTDLVQSLYQQFLHRAADPGGLSAFVSALQNGASDAQVVAALMGSAEYFTQLGATATTLVSSANPSVFGQSVTFTATVAPTAAAAGTPTGTVTFTDQASGATLGSGTLDANGQAAFSSTALTVGSHTITASYAGDGTFAAGSSSLSQTVNQAATATTLAASANPSVAGQAVTFTATVSATAPGAGTPTGTVTFTNQATGASLGSGSLDANGQATFSSSSLAVGTATVSASYGGDTNFASSTGSLSQAVSQASTTTVLASSINPSVSGQAVTLTATVSATAPGAGTPTGTVTFADQASGSTLGTATLDGNGLATFSATNLSVGSHTLTASYGGDSNFATSTGSVSQVVNQAVTATALVSSANPSVSGQAVTFTVTVTATAPGAGTPTGSISFTDQTNSTVLGSATLDANGQATFSSAALSVADHTIVAAYGGDTSLAASTGSVVQTVNQASTSVVLVSSANPSTSGQSVTFTATVSPTAPGAGTPTGTVTFTDQTTGTTLGAVSLDTSGQAALDTASLSVGTHTILAGYGGDSSFASSSASLDQMVS
jgi:hypothetical protein